MRGACRNQVSTFEAQRKEAEINAVEAEEIASHAMKAAENAVRDEMEAEAVTKETKKALSSALAGLNDLGISFAEVDERTALERAKSLEQTKVLYSAGRNRGPGHVPSRDCDIVAGFSDEFE